MIKIEERTSNAVITQGYHFLFMGNQSGRVARSQLVVCKQYPLLGWIPVLKQSVDSKDDQQDVIKRVLKTLESSQNEGV